MSVTTQILKIRQNMTMLGWVLWEKLGRMNIIYKPCSLIALSMHFQFKHWFTFGSLNIKVMIIWQFIQISNCNHMSNLTHGSWADMTKNETPDILSILFLSCTLFLCFLVGFACISILSIVCCYCNIWLQCQWIGRLLSATACSD